MVVSASRRQLRVDRLDRLAGCFLRRVLTPASRRVKESIVGMSTVSTEAMVKIAVMATASMALTAAIAAKVMASMGSMTTVTGSRDLVDYSVMVTVGSKDDWVWTVTYNRN